MQSKQNITSHKDTSVLTVATVNYKEGYKRSRSRSPSCPVEQGFISKSPDFKSWVWGLSSHLPHPVSLVTLSSNLSVCASVCPSTWGLFQSSTSSKPSPQCLDGAWPLGDCVEGIMHSKYQAPCSVLPHGLSYLCFQTTL